MSLIHSTHKAGPNMGIYGTLSEYGFLRTGWRPIRMQDSLKPYNIICYINRANLIPDIAEAICLDIKKQKNETTINFYLIGIALLAQKYSF